MLKYSIFCQELMKLEKQNDIKRVSVYVDYTELFVTVNNAGIKINADVNGKN